MQLRPPKENGGLGGTPAVESELKIKRSLSYTKSLSDSKPFTVAVVPKGPASELRVQLTTWRGQHRVEIREATATIPGIFFPTGTAIMLDVRKLPELIEAMGKAEIEAVARGLLPAPQRPNEHRR